MSIRAILIGLGWFIFVGIIAPLSTRADDCGGISCRCMNCDPPVPKSSHSTSDDPPHVKKQREEQPKPLSSEELARLKARQTLAVAQKQQIKGELARISRGFQIQRSKQTIELIPRGSDLFNIQPDSGERDFGQVMVASLSGVGTPATRIPVENLNRAAAILSPIMQAFKAGNTANMSDEDMSFLAGQSALAMEGAPLSVEIREIPSGREDATRRLVQQAQDIETVRAASERATTERLRVEEQLVKVQNDLQSGKGDTEGLKSQREIVLQSYKAAYIAEAKKKAEVHDMTGKVRIEWELGHGVSP